MKHWYSLLLIVEGGEGGGVDTLFQIRSLGRGGARNSLGGRKPLRFGLDWGDR